jgi:hypothetical protein
MSNSGLARGLFAAAVVMGWPWRHAGPRRRMLRRSTAAPILTASSAGHSHRQLERRQGDDLRAAAQDRYSRWSHGRRDRHRCGRQSVHRGSHRAPHNAHCAERASTFCPPPLREEASVTDSDSLAEVIWASAKNTGQAYPADFERPESETC